MIHWRGVRARQLRRPQGLLGEWVDYTVLGRKEQRARIRWSLQLAQLRPRDRLLELGCGSGYALSLAGRRLTEGMMLGLDHSPLMIAKAAQRCAESLERERLALMVADAEQPGLLRGPFSRVLVNNVAHYWSHPADTLKALSKALIRGALVVITYQPTHHKATEAECRGFVVKMQQALEQAGFAAIRSHPWDEATVPTVALTARWPGPISIDLQQSTADQNANGDG